MSIGETECFRSFLLKFKTTEATEFDQNRRQCNNSARKRQMRSGQVDRRGQIASIGPGVMWVSKRTRRMELEGKRLQGLDLGDQRDTKWLEEKESEEQKKKSMRTETEAF